MSDQPIIIEQSFQQNTKDALNNQNIFFQIMDEVQNYDHLTRQIRRKYEEAMLLFAHIKFNNPNALTPHSHRCLPAFLTLNTEGNLQEGYSKFTNQVEQDQFFQFQQQQEIIKDCSSLENTLQSQVKQNSYNSARQGQVLYRFNVLNQHSEVISASNKFYELLSSLLKLSKTRSQLQTKLRQKQRNMKK